GDGGLGGQAAFDGFQKAHAPGVAVTVLLLAEQEAERGVGVAADQDRAAGLEDLVQGGDADGTEVLAVVVAGGDGHGAADDVVNGAQGKGVVEEVAEQLDDAAQGAMADEDQSEDELAQPGLGDGQVEQGAVVAGGTRSGVEGL